MLKKDRCGKYESPFVQICTDHDIMHQTIDPYTYQQNRIAKCMNKTIKRL